MVVHGSPSMIFQVGGLIPQKVFQIGCHVFKTFKVPGMNKRTRKNLLITLFEPVYNRYCERIQSGGKLLGNVIWTIRVFKGKIKFAIPHSVLPRIGQFVGTLGWKLPVILYFSGHVSKATVRGCSPHVNFLGQFFDNLSCQIKSFSPQHSAVANDPAERFGFLETSVLVFDWLERHFGFKFFDIKVTVFKRRLWRRKKCPIKTGFQFLVPYSIIIRWVCTWFHRLWDPNLVTWAFPSFRVLPKCVESNVTRMAMGDNCRKFVEIHAFFVLYIDTGKCQVTNIFVFYESWGLFSSCKFQNSHRSWVSDYFLPKQIVLITY